MPSTVNPELLRDRLYEAYASTHAGTSDQAHISARFASDIRSLLPSDPGSRILDIGCGQGALVRACLNAGYGRTRGIDVSPEQVAVARAAGLGSAVVEGDLLEYLESAPAGLDVVLATDVLEHLTRPELVATMDAVRLALAPAGVLIARVPNAGSPYSGLIRHGDLTHESWFTVRSLRQLCSATDFEAPDVFPCAPSAHGVLSSARVAVWRIVSATRKLALAAETGVVRGHVVTQNMTFRAQRRP